MPVKETSNSEKSMKELFDVATSGSRTDLVFSSPSLGHSHKALVPTEDKRYAELSIPV